MKIALFIIALAVLFSCEWEEECITCKDTYYYEIIFPQKIYDTTYTVCPEREGIYLLEYKSEIFMDEEDMKSFVPSLKDSVFYLDGRFSRRRVCQF